MWARQRWNFIHWPITTKLAAVLFVTIALPGIIFLIPYSYTQREREVRGQQRVRLESLGPFAAARADQVLQQLALQLERQIYSASDYSRLEEYLYIAPWNTSEQTRRELEAFIENKMLRMMRAAPSLSRTRFFDPQGDLLVDASRQSGIINVRQEAPKSDDTPGNVLIESGAYGARETVSEIYLDSAGNLSIDVLFALRPVWDQFGTADPLGFAVFTQDLALAAGDTLLPNLMGTLRDVPVSDYPIYIYLVNESGQVLISDLDTEPFSSIRSSEGFQLVYRGATSTTVYENPLLDEDVLGYQSVISRAFYPRLILLVETPMAELREEVLKDTAALAGALGLGFLALSLLALYIGRSIITQPIERLTRTAREVAGGNLSLGLSQQDRRDEIGRLNNAFYDMSHQVITIIDELERRVADRTRNLQTTLEVGRFLTSIRDLDTLLEEVVNLILERFERIYHAQIFLIDPATNRAVLRASTGTVGQTLLNRGHYLEVGSQSVIGSVTATGHAVVALDTSRNPLHRRNEFLPNTRAEMALPLRISDRIIGALDLQSTLPDAFTEQDVDVFQGMADQITVAIENAALFLESTQRLQEIERLNRSLTEVAWRDTTRQRGDQLSASAGESAPGGSGWTDLQREVLRTGQIAESIGEHFVTFAVPVTLRDQVLGAVEWQVPRTRYTQHVRRTAMELSQRLALTAENLRLFEQSRRAAQREVVVNEISSKLIGTTDVDQILQMAVRELGLALGVPQVAIQLNPLARPALDGENHE